MFSRDLSDLITRLTICQSSDGGFITAWSNELKLQLETGDNGSPSSEAGGSSAVYDGGDSGQLHQRRQRSASDPTSTDKEQLIKDVGSTFHFPSHIPKEYALELKAATLQDASPSCGDTAIQIDTEDGSRLENKILAALEVSAERLGRRFLPFNQMDKIFTYEAVFEELQTHFRDATPEEVSLLAHQVCDEFKQADSSLTTRRKIFGTLVRINKAEWITHFINEGLFDSDLPFYFPNSNEQQEPVTRMTKKGQRIPIKFPRWRYFERESFEQRQWEFLAPFFEVTPTNGKRWRPLDYFLGDNTILPFTEDFEGESMGDMISAGYSEVWRVRIHPSHHSHPSVRHDHHTLQGP